MTRIAAVGLHEERQRLGHTDGVGQPSETRGLGFRVWGFLFSRDLLVRGSVVSFALTRHTRVAVTFYARQHREPSG